MMVGCFEILLDGETLMDSLLCLLFIILPMCHNNSCLNHLVDCHRLLPAVGIDFLILLCCSSCSALGFLTVSSIDKIVHAASVAAFKALILTTAGSHTNISLLLPTPEVISTPR